MPPHTDHTAVAPTAPLGWRDVVSSLTRPYPVTPSMLLLVSLIPLYVFIPALHSGRTLHVPALALDRAIPLVPAWVLVYAAFYFFLIVLPVIVVRQREHIRRTVRGYLFVWLASYVVFVAYPTTASRPDELAVGGFATWLLAALYAADPPFNCLPSLHVAHSFVSALTCLRLHRGVGRALVGCASLVALSTLFIKQHYVLDVVGGVSLALVAWALFLRRVEPATIPETDRRLVPVLTASVAAFVALVVACGWGVYAIG